MDELKEYDWDSDANPWKKIEKYASVNGWLSIAAWTEIAWCKSRLKITQLKDMITYLKSELYDLKKDNKNLEEDNKRLEKENKRLYKEMMKYRKELNYWKAGLK